MAIADAGALANRQPPAAPRPDTVPSDAEWNVRAGEWELTPRDAMGRPEGVVRSWRTDGTRSSEYEYRAGELEGAFKRFHPDGSIAREGLFRAGRQHGTTVAHGYDGPGLTPEPMQSCCVPPGAWQLQQDFEDGGLSEVRWYDRAGVRLLRSGAPHPRRPEGVPREARFDEGRDQWAVASYSGGGRPEGVWLRWTRDGVLREHDEYREGKAHGLWQRFDEAGNLREQSEWRDGARSGSFRRLRVPVDLYADARVFEERGAFERDQAVGAWSLLDADGTALRLFDLGSALDDAALGASPVLAEAAPAIGETWLATARELETGGRIAEAILASARAAAASGDVRPLRAALERLALPRKATSAQGLAVEIVARASRRLDLVANGLAYGADGATLLRSLASSLTGRDRVALDLADAAVLLSPDRSDCRLTRALVHVHLGRPDAARSDVASLPPELAGQREFLELHTQILFPAFGFTPATTKLQTRWPEVPDGPGQPLDRVRVQIQKYATRLGHIRAAVLARLALNVGPLTEPASLVSAPWCPPDLSNLLPEGPVPLETWQFEETLDEPGDRDETSDQPSDAPDAKPPETELVTVDETIMLEEATPLPALMRAARRDWNGLCWLCWGVGLDSVAMPDAILPRDGFGIALGMSVERLWRCRDRILTSGLRSRMQGVPDFEWEGVPIDRLSPIHAEIAADEYREMRAVLCWLYDDSVQSPWQDNVRKVD